MERRPKVNQGQNRNREIWLSGIVGGLVETCCNGLITICHEVENDGYSGSYWPKTGVRHISISTVSGGTLSMVTTVANVNKGQAKRTQRTMKSAIVQSIKDKREPSK